MAKPAFSTLTIANGTSLSGALDLSISGGPPVGIQMPAAWTAANLTFQVSHDGTTYQNFQDAAGTEIVAVAAASVFIALDPTIWFGVRFLKARSGTAGIPVNQGAERLLQLVFLAV